MPEYSWDVGEMDEITGGIVDTLNLFYGETGTGKTTLSAYVPITRIYTELKREMGEVPDNARFIVVDGDDGFDPRRARQIWKNNGLNPDRVLNHVEYYRPTTFDQQHKLLKKKIRKKIEENDWKPVFIAADPMTAIYRGIILRTDMKYRAKTIGTYTGKLDLQMNELKDLGNKYDMPVFISTWPSSEVGEALGEGEQGEVPFIGGRQFGFLPKVIVRIEKIDEPSPKRKATIWKSRFKPEGISAEFTLSDGGISEIE